MPKHLWTPPLRQLVALVLLVLSVCLPAPSAHADDDPKIGLRYEVLADPTGKLGIHDMADAAFRPFSSSFGGGLDAPDYWLRITFTDPDPAPLTLRFRPKAVDRIQLFTPLPDGSFRISEAGDSIRPTANAFSGLEWHSFAVDPHPGQGPFYVRIDTQTVSAITVSAITRHDEPGSNITAAGWAALMLALHLLAITLVILRLDPLGSPTVMLFLLLITESAFYRFWIAGYGPVAFGIDDPALSERIGQIMTSVIVLTLIAFHHEFLRPYAPPRPLQHLNSALLALSVVSLAAALLNASHLSISLSFVCYALLIPILLVLAVTLRKDGAIPLRQLRFFYVSYSLVLAANVAVRMGLFDNEFLYRYSIEILNLIGVAMLLALLALQDQSARQAQLNRELSLAEVAASLRIAKTFHANQLDLIRGIDHHARRVFDEARAAVEAGEFRTAGPKAERSITSLRAVIDRGLLAHQSVNDTWRITPALFDPGETLRGIATTLAPAQAWCFVMLPCTLNSDRDLFSLVARNLLSNALRYGTPGQPVTVYLRPDRHGAKPVVSMAISNPCQIMNPFDPDRVFDKFYRGPSSRDRDGTGLGLFIAKDAVTALGGKIALGASPDGSIVTATLWVPSQ